MVLSWRRPTESATRKPDSDSGGSAEELGWTRESAADLLEANCLNGPSASRRVLGIRCDSVLCDPVKQVGGPILVSSAAVLMSKVVM